MYKVLSIKYYRLGIMVLALAMFVMLPIFVQAQGRGIIPECGTRNPAGGLNKECGFDDLIILINNIISELIKFAIPVSAAVFAWAGFKLMTTAVVDQKTEAKKMMQKVVIGLAIILAAWLITNTLSKALFNSGYTNIIQPQQP